MFHHRFDSEQKLGNITFYKCDVSNWEEVETVAKKVIQEV